MLIDKEYNWRGKTILIAEDEDINYMFVERVLLATNVTLVRANNGQHAIDIVNSNPDINLVLMDIRMPDVNGIEAAEAIKKIRPELPVVAQTCYEKDLILDDYPKAHFDGFICKPVNINKLFEIIDHLF